MSVRRWGGTPSRNASPGSAFGANWFVMIRFTNTTPASEAGINAKSASTSRAVVDVAVPATPKSAAASRSAVTTAIDPR